MQSGRSQKYDVPKPFLSVKKRYNNVVDGDHGDRLNRPFETFLEMYNQKL